MKTKSLCALSVIILTVSLLSSCIFTNMPLNGDIKFHEISLTIDKKFVRDSTQSTEDLWIFERGNYSEYIIISKKDAGADVNGSLNGYVEYLTREGAQAKLTIFLDNNAVSSSYTKDGMYCQEMLFVYGQSFYTIALRGGDKDSFNALLDTVKLL